MGRDKGTREPKNRPPTPLLQRFKVATIGPYRHPHIQPGTMQYRMNGCLILVSPPYQEQGWHLSISHTRRYPTWEEIAFAWYTLVPEAETRSGVLVLPPIEDYINIHEYCMQVHELLDRVAAGLHQ